MTDAQVALMLSLVALGLVGLGVVVGLALAHFVWEAKRHCANQQAALVQAEWDALLRAQRIQAGYVAARQALWSEATRHG